MSRKLMPSIPRWYCAPMLGIQSWISTNLNCCSGDSCENQKTSGSDTRKLTNMTMLPHQRMACLFAPGMNMSAISPTAGVNRIKLKM